ncbi:hypothetical protein IW261DRAFT_1578296 [Armillaria novae-zelandiae]|uniref:Uncharacterized protein n=1 Tax=Armillaria novae-zelandiae TaxID=153914 RepID=A0AA39KIM0_9AGAR|nr:hypothetical protein IW261DRAFT_1578296 [Armillaria novae-zelandiae]
MNPVVSTPASPSIAVASNTPQKVRIVTCTDHEGVTFLKQHLKESCETHLRHVKNLQEEYQEFVHQKRLDTDTEILERQIEDMKLSMHLQPHKDELDKHRNIYYETYRRLKDEHRLEISAIQACNKLSLDDIQSTIRLLSLIVHAAVSEFQKLLVDQVHNDMSTRLQERLHQTRTLHEACQHDRNMHIADLERALASAENDGHRLEADLQRSREILDAGQYRGIQEVTDIPTLKRYLDQEFETLGKLLQGGTAESSDECESVMSW